MKENERGALNNSVRKVRQARKDVARDEERAAVWRQGDRR